MTRDEAISCLKGSTSSCLVLWTCLLPLCVNGWSEDKTGYILRKMEEAYARVSNYQAQMEVESYGPAGSKEETRALYTFKKPNRIRIELESPRKGWVLTYPDEHGKVVVKPAGILGFFLLHLDPENELLQFSPGQSINETDIGLLIRNISKSLTEKRKGEVDASCEEGGVKIHVLAEDHFEKETLTDYTFVVDRDRWLPVKVEERNPEGTTKKIVVFKDLQVNLDLTEDFFEN